MSAVAVSPTNAIGASAPFPELIETSLADAAFLWSRWEGELTSPTRTLDDVWSWTEDRLHGALDGVRVAADALPAAVTPALEGDDPHATACAAALLAASPAPAARDALLSLVATASGAKLGHLIRGVELSGANATLSAVAMTLAAGSLDHQAALCRLKTFRRVAPGQEMVAAFKSGAPAHQLDAIRGVRAVPPDYLEEWIAAGLRSTDARVRLATVSVGLQRGVGAAWQAALRIGSTHDAEAASYLHAIALCGSSSEHDIVYDALRIPALQSQAIWALGHVGTARAAEACLYGMQHEKLARAAGEAYCWITGAELTRDHLAVIASDAAAPDFENDDLDANLVPEPAMTWPQPDLALVRRHWEAVKAQFPADVRHVRGRVATLEWIVATVEHGPMLRRPDLLLELAVRSSGRYDVEPRAFADRQRQMMRAGRAALAGAR